MDAITYDPQDHVLRIGGVEIEDREVLREATRWTTGERGEPVKSRTALAEADLGPFVRETVTVGARVLAIAAGASDTEAVQIAVRTASDQVADVTRRASEASEDAVRRATETLTSTTRQVHQSLTDQVNRLVGGESPELMEKLRPILAGVGTSLEKQLVDAVDAANKEIATEALRRHDELVALVRDTHQAVAVRVAEEAASAAVKGVTTIKGFDYEAQIHDAFAQIAALIGDEYEETGEFAGRLPRNKKGDGVMHVGGGSTRIVIEAHDGTAKEWGSYLAEAERNRAAAASIGVVRRIEDNGGRTIRVVAQKRLVVAYDPAIDGIELLHTAVLLMRTVALTTSGRFGTEGVATANEHIREALVAIEDLDDAKKSANAIVGHTAKIEQAITRTVTSIQRDLTQALNALTGVETGTPETDEDVAETVREKPPALVRVIDSQDPELPYGDSDETTDDEAEEASA